MRNANVTRVKKTDTLVPASIVEADNLLGKLGRTQDEINKIENNLQKEIDKLKAEALEKLQPLEVQLDKQMNKLFTFANPRKLRLTIAARSVTLSMGTFGWRMTTPRIEMNKSDEEMIKFLKKTGNAKFIRIKEEIDRQALLAERPRIFGIDYVQNDEFYAIPRLIGRGKKTLTKAIDR